MGIAFKNLKIHEWQQFQDVDIDFHDKVTVLTGANGSGKTTIFTKLLAGHFGWSMQSLATPKNVEESGGVEYLPLLYDGEFWNRRENDLIGFLEYTNGVISRLTVQHDNKKSPKYDLKLTNQQPVPCLFIPSHRSVFRYQRIGNLPLVKKNNNAAFLEVSNNENNRYNSNNSVTSNSSLIKNTLIGWAINGYGVTSNSKVIMMSDKEQIDSYEGFKEVLRKLFPKILKFEDFEIRDKEIVFVCNQGKSEFILEQVSGGISAIIELAWQMFTFSTDKSSFTVIIDEVENHLHPTMQRQILPNLVKAFPHARFIVSTHSPLVIGSVRDSNIYALIYNDDGNICSQRLDFKNAAKTATEILDEVLGVSFTMPLWAEEKLEEIVKKFSTRDMSGEEFEEMRSDLKSSGLESLMPEAISSILENK